MSELLFADRFPRSLARRDSTNVSDIHCVVTIGPTSRLKRVTRTKYETQNTVFNETYVFEGVLLTDEERAREKIGLNLYDRNTFLANTRIGGIEFSLDNVYRQKNHEYFRKWVSMALPDAPGREQGYLHVSVHVLKKGDTIPSHDAKETLEGEVSKDVILRDPQVERKMFVLNCLVYRAEGIQATHGKSLNPFVSVRFNGVTAQTTRMASLSNPIWNRKIIIPFQLPLTSDTIEIQVWNYNFLARDTLIGSRSFSYYEEGLTHRAWGPCWINMYSSDFVSPKTTLFGSLLDAFTHGEHVGEDEFVGRVLARLSVRPVNALLNPRLRSVPCAPAVEPDGETYVLDFGVCTATEVPTEGGKLTVEVCFGSQRIASRPVLGVAGTFQWNQVLEPLEWFGPEDVSQAPDVIVNMYHISGRASRKIAFLRIPASELLDRSVDHGYMVNGSPLPARDCPWKPIWRQLSNVRVDSTRPHLIAGFLLSWIGLGIKSQRPSTVPSIVSTARTAAPKHTLRVYLHSASDLPAGTSQGLADPFVVMRFAGRTRVSRVVRGTTWPAWQQMLEVRSVPIDAAYAPAVQLLVYHRAASAFHSNQLLGRCKIPTGPLLAPAGSFSRDMKGLLQPVLRYPLSIISFAQPHDGAAAPPTQRSYNLEQDSNSRVPSLVARIELFPDNGNAGTVQRPLSVGWDAKTGLGSPKCIEYSVRVDLLGVFGSKSAASRNAVLQVRCDSTIGQVSGGHGRSTPGSSGGKDVSRMWDVPLKLDSTGNAIAAQWHVFDCIAAPRLDLYCPPLVFELRSSSGRLLAVCHVPLADILGGHAQRPRAYRTPESTNLDATAKSVLDSLISEEQKKQRMLERLRREAQKTNRGQDFKDSIGGDRLPLEPHSTAVLNLSSYTGNVHLEMKTGLRGRGERARGPVSLGGSTGLTVSPYEVSSRTTRATLLDGRGAPALLELALLRGPAVGLPRDAISRKVQEKAASHTNVGAQEVEGIVKCFLRAAPRVSRSNGRISGQAVKLGGADLSRFARVYGRAYVVRIYIYHAAHLAPPSALLSSGGQAERGVHAYLVVSNGSAAANTFSGKYQVSDRSVDLSPEFYRLVELPAHLPENGRVTVQVWDRVALGRDRLIGGGQLDIERRVLLGNTRGSHQWLNLTHPRVATSRGKLLVRMDVLTEKESRLIKPEELSGPQYTDYEFRLVLWQTVGIRFPEEKDRGSDVDQKIRVTVNFTGVPGADFVKETDVAWYAAGGSAEWNYRMLFPVRLPLKPGHARVKFAVWDENLLGSGENVGEAVWNLAPFFARAMQEKGSRTLHKPVWLKFRHSNFRGVRLGQIYVEASLYTKTEAEEFKVGEAQNEPNRLPYLANPKRNPPPWAIGSRALDYFAAQRTKIIILCTVCLLLVIAVPLVFVALTANSAS